MTELERIANNITGELPNSDNYGYIIVENVANPAEELKVFKEVISTILKHPELDDEDPQWKKLLPKQFTEFIRQLEDEDYRDELLRNIPSIIYRFRKVRGWEWYSSKLLDNGFEIVHLGDDINVMAIIILHHQGLPFTSLFSEKNGKFYETKRFGIDVLMRKTYNKKTFKLTKK